MQFHSFKRPQHHPHYCQQQEGQAGEGMRTAPLALGRWFHIVFFHLLHYLEQCVGGDGVEVGSHKPQSLQNVLALCYPRPIYAQASYNYAGSGTSASLTLSNSTVSSNVASYGGGVRNR